MITYFTTFQLIAIITAATLGILAITFLHMLKKYRSAILLLFLAAFAIRIAIIQFDPYLNYWDEQYHALVAKNMMQDAFKPMLYKDAVLPYQKEMWIANHIWLHKPPLFLWQMSLSMKVFGINEFGLRLPNVIMSMLCILMVYAMAKRWLNKYIAFYAVLMLSFSSYAIDLVSGYHHSEHNDVAFIFYVTLSLFAWSRYVDTRNIKWVVAVGLASGAAVMVKWLPGLLIYAAWGISALALPARRKYFTGWLHYIIAFAITLLVFLPWQVYTSLAFPEEYRITSMAKAQHFWKVIEGHHGGIFYHFNKLDIIYAVGVKLLLIPALLLMARKIQNNTIRVGFLSFFIVAFVFYSVAATKMPAFTLIASAVVYLALGTFIYELLLLFKPRYLRLHKFGRLSAILLLIGCLFWFFNIESLQKYHTNWHKDIGYHRSNRIHSVQVFKELANMHLDEATVVFNCKELDPVMLMFYTPYIAYSGLPDEADMDMLLNSGRSLAAFDNGQMDAFFERYPGIIRLDLGYYDGHNE
jgi:4-amino-4-deoxy-L-arabinose transferase-like glycosyltransferase